MKVLGVLVFSLLAMGLASCETVGDKAKVGAYYTISTYIAVWRPPLKFYGGLPSCGDPAVPPCQDEVLYKKLYDLDAAITDCGEASLKALTTDGADLSGVAPCIQTIERAKITLAQEGIMTLNKGGPQ